MNPKVYIASQFFAKTLKPILVKLLPSVHFIEVTFENANPEAKYWNWEMQVTDRDVDQLKDAEILITDNFVMGQLAYRLPKLKWLQGTFAGVDIPFKSVTKETLEKSGLPTFVATRYTGDSYGNLMFEYCLSFMISNERGFRNHERNQFTKDWTVMKSVTPPYYRLLTDLTVTILGVGSIGTVVSKLFKSVGCRVKGYSRTHKSDDYLKENGIDDFSTDLAQVLRQTDYIISILPHTPGTIHLLDGQFSACDTRPVFINLGRGSVISSNEITRAVDNEWISLAVLDVFEKEPLDSASELWTHPKVVITPHIGAETRPADLAKVFVENYIRFSNGQELKYKINWNAGY